VIVLVRHGETAANRERLALGRADPPLTATGERQAAALAGRLGSSGATRVISSPLGRAQQTATAIADALGIPVETDARLVEMDYGEWDERSFGDLPSEALARWRRDANFAPPGGESLAGVTRRVGAWCASLDATQHVVAVSHVSPIKAAVCWAVDGDPLLAWRMHLDVASITRVRNGDRPALVGFNDVGHLAEVRG
jgi:broad specificity phosphatase PhoE